MFFNLRDVPGLKKKPSTSELLDWLKLLLAEDIPPEALRSTRQEGADPAAARRAAQERAGRAPVRARRVHGAPQRGRTRISRTVSHVSDREYRVRPADALHRAGHADGSARDARAARARARGGARAPRRPTASCGSSGTRASRTPDKTRRRGSTPRSTCASAWARCRSSSATTRPATSSAHALFQRRRRATGGSRSATRGTRSACSAPPINTECKLLLLTHAFEALHCIAVEFRTHCFNFASRAAIARLGAKQDGILRNHQLHAGRHAARHRRVQHHRQRVAGGEAQPAFRLDDACRARAARARC